MPDQSFRLLGLPDQLVQPHLLLSQYGAALGPARRVEHQPHLPETEPGGLRSLDHHHPAYVRVVVFTPTGDAARRSQQPHLLPMPQHVRSQAETGRQFADLHPPNLAREEAGPVASSHTDQMIEATPPSIVTTAPVT